MSTKTTIKRVALVAASAITFAGISGVAAHAASPLATVVPAAAAASNTYPATVGSYYTIQVNETSTAANDSIITIANNGGSVIYPSSTATGTAIATSGSNEIWYGGATPGAGTIAANTSLTFSVYSATAGTQTLTISGDKYSGAQTVVINWGAAASASAGYSTAYIKAGSTNGTANDASTTYSDAATGNAVANIAVTLNSAASTAITGQGLSASITGPGSLSLTNTTTIGASAQGRSLSTSAASANGASWTVGIFADGSAGTSTITITSGSTVIATKTVTFYGSGTKAVATQNLYVAKAGTSTTLGNTLTTGAAATTSDLNTTTGQYAFTVAVTDASGNAAPASTPKVVSSNTAVIQSSNCYSDPTTTGTYYCNVVSAAGSLSGQSATVTFESQDSSGNYTVLANPLTFTVGGAITKEVLSTDATTYNALAPIKLSVTATDSNGNPAYDQYVSGGLVGSLVSSVALGGSTLTSPKLLVNGTASTSSNYAPYVGGSFTISGTDAVSTAGEAVSTTAAVNVDNTAADAAQLATDAANAATDAANAAAESADNATQAASDALAAIQDLQAQVAKLFAGLKAQIAALAKSVAAKSTAKK